MDIEIKVPVNVSNNYRSMEWLMKTYVSLKKTNKLDKVYFDFSNTKWFAANLVPLLATTFEKLYFMHGKEIDIFFKNVYPTIEDTFYRNGFYEIYNLGSKKDVYESTITFSIFKTSQEEDFADYLDEDVLTKIRLNRTQEEKEMFKTCLQEIFENTRMHANSLYLYTCGQYYHKKQLVAFTMADLGVTIGENVREKLGYNIIDQDAIDWATQFGNTTKKNGDGGIGLSVLKDYIEGNGKLIIFSGKGYWEIEKGKGIFKKTMKYAFDGTIITIVTDLEYEEISVDEPILF